MKATIPEVTVGAAEVARIGIGTLNAGPLQIGRLVLDGGHVEVETGAARFRNLRLTVGLAFRLTWQVRVTVPFAGEWSWGDTSDLGSHTVTVEIGDVRLPGLESFSVDVAGLEADGVSAVVGPLQDLHLGALLAERISVQDVQAPVLDFQILGLALARLGLDGFTVPAAAAGVTTIGRLHGEAFPLGTVTLPGLQLPQAATTDITGAGIAAAGTGRPLELPVDAGVLTLTLSVIPSAGVAADELRLSDVHARAQLGPVELHDVVLPYEVLDLTLGQIGLTEIAVPKLEVS